MTTANKVTILRMLLIPFFVVEVLYYVKDGHELHRLLAVLSFAVAAICDGVDGYIARRYNQRSELGAILDIRPIPPDPNEFGVREFSQRRGAGTTGRGDDKNDFRGTCGDIRRKRQP